MNEYHLGEVVDIHCRVKAIHYNEFGEICYLLEPIGNAKDMIDMPESDVYKIF